MATVAALEPGSAEWLKLVTASKVAAILGVSKWDSPRSLWHKMRGDVEPEAPTKVQSRGHYLEPAVLAWFFDQHPEFGRQPCGTFVHRELAWAAATPDAVAIDTDGKWPTRVLPVEAKTSADDAEWGVPGTDEIPVAYAAQCIWTCHVLGAEKIFVPMLTQRLEFREYIVHYDAALAADIEAKCWAFKQSLAGDEPPPVDSHPVTYETLKRVNALLVEKSEVQLTAAQARLFVQARRDQAAADAQSKLANSTVAEVMGTAHLAYYGDKLVARRQNTASGIPALYAAKPLPDIEKVEAA